MSVFKVDSNFKIVANTDAVKLVPELAYMTQEELLYIILVIDYEESPYRNKPFDERQRIAARRVFKKDWDPSIETKRIKWGMKVYKGLIFDIRRETIDEYKNKIKKLHRELLRDDVPINKIKDIDRSIQFLEDRVENMQKNVRLDEEKEIQIKGKKSLSFIEKWQKNQQQYKEFLKENV